MGYKPFTLFLPLTLAGCAWVRDDVALSNQRGWEALTRMNYGQVFADISGLSALMPGPAAEERAADAQLCLHANSEARVMTQNGVEDAVEYRRCPVSPYGTELGARMENRPEF